MAFRKRVSLSLFSSTEYRACHIVDTVLNTSEDKPPKFKSSLKETTQPYQLNLSENWLRL